jgi:hypothetical protein
MRSPYYPPRKRRQLLASISRANAQDVREDRHAGDFIVTLGDVDLPAFVSAGQLYVQAPLPHIFKAFAENISAFVSDMEIRVSDSRGTTFPLDSDGRPVHGAELVEPSVVSDRREW